MKWLPLNDWPRSVGWAIYLMVAAAALGLLVLVADAALGADALVVVFFVALELAHLALVLAIASGRRWAFVIYVLWFVYDVLRIALFLRIDASLAALSIGFVAVQLVPLILEGAAIALLLTPNGRAWLASPSGAS